MKKRILKGKRRLKKKKKNYERRRRRRGKKNYMESENKRFLSFVFIRYVGGKSKVEGNKSYFLKAFCFNFMMVN